MISWNILYKAQPVYKILPVYWYAGGLDMVYT